jgi:hypothetical protein
VSPLAESKFSDKKPQPSFIYTAKRQPGWIQCKQTNKIQKENKSSQRQQPGWKNFTERMENTCPKHIIRKNILKKGRSIGKKKTARVCP